MSTDPPDLCPAHRHRELSNLVVKRSGQLWRTLQLRESSRAVDAIDVDPHDRAAARMPSLRLVNDLEPQAGMPCRRGRQTARSTDYAHAIASGREQWRGVRHQRADPPALAGRDEDRKQVFQSALAQAEELWDAASVAGPASRPLPLFYCVSQAGRAVCAAWTSTDEWRPRHHGLKRRESDATAPEARALDYAAAVTSQPLGIYAMVAEATASSTFEGFATVADLWASLPGGRRRTTCLGRTARDA